MYVWWPLLIIVLCVATHLGSPHKDKVRNISFLTRESTSDKLVWSRSGVSCKTQIRGGVWTWQAAPLNSYVTNSCPLVPFAKLTQPTYHVVYKLPINCKPFTEEEWIRTSLDAGQMLWGTEQLSELWRWSRGLRVFCFFLAHFWYRYHKVAVYTLTQ